MRTGVYTEAGPGCLFQAVGGVWSPSRGVSEVKTVAFSRPVFLGLAPHGITREALKSTANSHSQGF